MYCQLNPISKAQIDLIFLLSKSNKNQEKTSSAKWSFEKFVKAIWRNKRRIPVDLEIDFTEKLQKRISVLQWFDEKKHHNEFSLLVIDFTRKKLGIMNFACCFTKQNHIQCNCFHEKNPDKNVTFSLFKWFHVKKKPILLLVILRRSWFHEKICILVSSPQCFSVPDS